MDNCDDSLFKEIMECSLRKPTGNFTPKESCLSSLSSENILTQSTHKSIVPINTILQEDLSIKENSYKLSSFHMCCGLSKDIVNSVIYAYLANKHKSELKNIYKNTSIDLNILAWMLYHRVEIKHYTKSIKFEHKNSSFDHCVICLANLHIDIFGKYRITMSPEVMSGNRVGMSRDPTKYDCHFVIWSNYHNRKIEDWDIIDSIVSKFWPHGYEIYWHGNPSYGHDHIHIINGEFHDIRAREIMIIAQKCINKDKIISVNDYFHPIRLFYRNCTFAGRECLIVSYIISRLRLKIDNRRVDLVHFYSMAYMTLYKDIMNFLEK